MRCVPDEVNVKNLSFIHGDNVIVKGTMNSRVVYGIIIHPIENTPRRRVASVTLIPAVLYERSGR